MVSSKTFVGTIITDLVMPRCWSRGIQNELNSFICRSCCIGYMTHVKLMTIQLHNTDKSTIHIGLKEERVNFSPNNG